MKILIIAGLFGLVSCGNINCEVRVVETCGEITYKADFNSGSNVFNTKEEANLRCNEHLAKK